MMLDVYVCTSCDKEFAVKDGEVPNYCPFDGCQLESLEFSHEVERGDW